MTAAAGRRPAILGTISGAGGDGSAVSGHGRSYRYLLTRRWGVGPTAVFVMLNPSTADAERDDPTLTRCVSFARREGCAALAVVNLFALRSPDPRVLARHRDPVGPRNDTYIAAACAAAPLVVAAWGTGGRLHGRAAQVTAMLARAGVRLWCVGTTKDGSPRHPLYVRGSTPLILSSPPDASAAAAGGGG